MARPHDDGTRRGGFSARLGVRRLRHTFGARRMIFAARLKVRRAAYRGGRGRRGCAFSAARGAEAKLRRSGARGGSGSIFARGLQ